MFALFTFIIRLIQRTQVSAIDPLLPFDHRLYGPGHAIQSKDKHEVISKVLDGIFSIVSSEILVSNSVAIVCMINNTALKAKSASQEMSPNEFGFQESSCGSLESSGKSHIVGNG